MPQWASKHDFDVLYIAGDPLSQVENGTLKLSFSLATVMVTPARSATDLVLTLSKEMLSMVLIARYFVFYSLHPRLHAGLIVKISLGVATCDFELIDSGVGIAV